MILYLVGTNPELVLDGDALGLGNLPPNMGILVSYATMTRTWVETIKWLQVRGVRIFIDSGAYSAATIGKPVSLDSYVDFLHGLDLTGIIYANLDVIGDADASSQNLAAMEKSGLAPLPVFHFGSSLHHLDRLVEQYDYIALGGMVGTPASKTLPWAARCAERSNRARFHAFGQTSTKMMYSFDWQSVDSSAWTAGIRYGDLPIFSGGAAKTIRREALQYSMRLRSEMREVGVDPDKILANERKSWVEVLKWSVHVWTLVAQRRATVHSNGGKK